MGLKRMSVLLLSGGMAFSVLAAESKPTPKKSAEARPDDLVCVYERSTGSNIGRRVCATRKEREERAQRDRDEMQRLQDRNQLGSPPSTGK